MRSNQQDLDHARLQFAFLVPFFATEETTTAEALGAIKQMLTAKVAEGKPAEQAALEIIHDRYQGMPEEFWPYLQGIRLHYVALLDGRERLPKWAL